MATCAAYGALPGLVEPCAREATHEIDCAEPGPFVCVTGTYCLQHADEMCALAAGYWCDLPETLTVAPIEL